ncbi:MAG: chorismate--pyruvate lyase [Oscillospiraceae bacterium]
MGPYDYVVESLNGDYAYLRRTDIPDSGEPFCIALALLPEGIDVGTKMRWENLSYTIC